MRSERLPSHPRRQSHHHCSMAGYLPNGRHFTVAFLFIPFFPHLSAYLAPEPAHPRHAINCDFFHTRYEFWQFSYAHTSVFVRKAVTVTHGRFLRLKGDQFDIVDPQLVGSPAIEQPFSCTTSCPTAVLEAVPPACEVTCRGIDRHSSRRPQPDT